MATPQIPFISAPVKKTDDVDWIHPLKKYIARFYQDDPEKYKEETQSFNRLRQDIRGAGKDMTGRDLLYRYFGQLELLDLRFPVDEKHVKVLFNWYDAFNNKPISQYSLAFEKASVIFNEAATLSAIASSQNRAEAEGRKKAFRYFQASAGMFQYINDNFLHAPSEDLSRDTVNLLSELMLAQAQECFLESSIREKAKNGLIAKLASHVTWVYGNLVDSLGDAVTRGVGVDKAWILLCQIKQKYYAAVAQQHKAAACEAEAKYGECVGRYIAAESAGKEAVKLAAGLQSALLSSNHANNTIPAEAGAAVQDLTKSLSATCTEQVASSTRDNDLIYHENVPQESILTPIDRLKAVKTLPISELYGPDEMKKIIGGDLFSKLIPISVHESASLYSEEIAKLLRAENEKCDIAKAELNASLDYMKLPGSLNKFRNQQQSNSSLDEYATPSSDVRNWANQIASEERRQPITDLIHSLTMLKQKAKQTLDDASLLLDKEMRDCEQGRVQYGDQWTQPPSGPLTSEFRHDISNHRRTLENASQSDNQLLAKYEAARKNIDILKHGGQSHELEKVYAEALSNLLNGGQPTRQNSATVDLLDIDFGTTTIADEKDDQLEEKVKRVESIIEKLRRIENDRDETFLDLKEKTMQDDISQLLILNKKSNVEQQIFSSELEKYRPHQQRITATIQHQQQAIQDLTAAFKSLMEGDAAKNLQKKHDKAERLRRNLTADFSEAKSSYDEIRDGLSRGVQFYTGVQDTVDALQHNIHRFTSERSNERNRLKETIESSKSTREQELLRETLNKYTGTSSSVPPSNISQLTNQTRQLSISEPSAPVGYAPPPPPKPQAFVQQQQQQPPSPYGMYGSNTYTPPQQQTQHFASPPPQSPMQSRPMYNPPYQPVSNNYMPQQQPPPIPPNPQASHYNPPAPQQQVHSGYFGHVQASPATQQPPYQQYQQQQQPPPQQQPPQQQYTMPQQGYQQYQQTPQPQQWQQPQQQQPQQQLYQPYQQPQQQWQGYPQQQQQQRPPGNLLD